MRKKILAPLFICALFLVAMATTFIGHASEPAPLSEQVTNAVPVADAAAVPDVLQNVNLDPLANFLQGQSAAHPWILTTLIVIGALRLLIKPIVAAAHSVAEKTDTPKDDELIAKIESSRALKIVEFGFDWLGSLKIRK